MKVPVIERKTGKTLRIEHDEVDEKIHQPVHEWIASQPPRRVERVIYERSRTAAVEAKCVDCCAGSRSEAKKCVAYSCPLWPYRPGAGRNARIPNKIPDRDLLVKMKSHDPRTFKKHNSPPLRRKRERVRLRDPEEKS